MKFIRSHLSHLLSGCALCSLMLIANSASAAQALEFSLRWDNDDKRYHVFMRPNSTPTPDISMTGQATIRVPHATGTDRFFPSNLNSAVSNTFWSQNSRADKPDEADSYDYISFTLMAMDPRAFNWQADTEQEVFSFGNSGSCLGPIELINEADPFNQIPNSRGTSPGNQFTNIGWGGVEGNNYQGIYGTAADCNQAPVIISGNSITTPENTNGTVLDINSTDDSDSEGSGLIYSLTGNGADDDLFRINPTSGAVSFINPPDFEAPADSDDNNSYIIEARVCDSALLCTSQTINITVSDVNENTAPVITSGDSVTVPENSNNTVFDISSTDDSDSEGAGLTYSLTGNGADDNRLTIDPISGAISFITPPDFESPADSGGDNSYSIEARVCDTGALCDTQTISLTVTDTNENTAPLINSVANIYFAENSTAIVLDISATDDSSSEATGTLTYSLTGSPGGHGDDTLFTINPLNGELSFHTPPDYENPRDEGGDNTYQLSVHVCDEENSCSSQTLVVSISNDDAIKLQLRTYLQGAYDSSTGMMDDMLRTLDLLPTEHPYTDAPFDHESSETLSPSVTTDIANAGDNVVDWVLAELRSVSDPTVVIASQALMVQRDGDLVNSTTGSADLTFSGVAEGAYYIGIRHRNHLGVVTLNPVVLSENTVMTDFTLPSTLIMYDDSINPTRLEHNGITMMWAGDANQNKNIVAFGDSNDSTSVLSDVLAAPLNNVDFNSNYILRGYHHSDLNMDGMTIFAGRDNDINILLGNIMLHPNNSLLVANFILRGSFWRMDSAQ